MALSDIALTDLGAITVTIFHPDIKDVFRLSAHIPRRLREAQGEKISSKFKAEDIKEATEKIGKYTDKEGYELKTYVRNDDGSYDIEMILPSEKTEGEKIADPVETVEFQKSS